MASTRRPVALVTGGSRGIGRATVLRLARDGYDVAFCYSSGADAATELVSEARGAGGRILGLAADVSDAGQVRSLVDQTCGELGPIDVVVASAGITRDGPLVLQKDDDWSRVLQVNLDGTYNVCRAVIFDMMKRRTGCIITISSVAGVEGHATQTNYSAAKAGIIGFTRALAKETGRYGIRANVVAAGYIATDMTAAMSEKARDQALATIPLGRFGQADEVADLVSYLIAARYMTGSVVRIDGGVIL